MLVAAAREAEDNAGLSCVHAAATGEGRMLATLKKMFHSSGSPRKAKVNLDRRFTIVSETGQGSMSKVYRAVDNSTGRSICLKVQIPDKNQAAAARTHEHKPHEGELASKVGHPNVVRTFDFGVSTRGEDYLVMEYIDGNSLQFVREARTVTKLRDKLEILAQAAEGLAACHAAGILHHDINPRNYLVDRNGTVKLIDFGLAVPMTPEFMKPGNRTGTLNYMAPELVRRETIDARIDVFAFGALAFEFLTDRLPYDSTTSMAAMLARINHEPLDPAKANPALPAALHDLLRKLVARRKDQRWPKMETLPEALRTIAARSG
jgi:serine/threonine protein kinase